jgi:uncharacterized protein
MKQAITMILCALCSVHLLMGNNTEATMLLRKAIINQDEQTVEKLFAHRENMPDINDQTTSILGYTPLMLAAEKPNIAIIVKLLQHGANPNIRSENGESALTLAIKARHPNTAFLLILQGAQVNILDSNRYSPLVLALRSQATALIPFLVAAGADPNLKDSEGEYGNTIYDYADSEFPEQAAEVRGFIKLGFQLRNPESFYQGK